MPHAQSHGGGHGIDPAAEITAKFENGDLSLKDGSYRRFWSNLLVNGFFFFGITIGAMFYLALHYATESGWGVVSVKSNGRNCNSDANGNDYILRLYLLLLH